MMLRRIGLHAALFATVLATAATLATVAASPASATSRWPSAPARVRLAAISSTSITVTGSKVPNTPRYRLYVSRVKNDLYYTGLAKRRSTRSVATSARPSVTVSGLHYAATPLYYRYATLKGSHMRMSKLVSTTYLRPSAPWGVIADGGNAGLHVQWSSVAATGFRVVQATDPGLTQNRRVYTLRRQANQLTPSYDISRGVTYYFRVWALNGTSASAASALVSATAANGTQPVRVLTYNLLGLSFDGHKEGDGTVASWNGDRRDAAAALVRRADPDIIAVQEAGGWTHGWQSATQAQSLAAVLGRQYTVARTEIPAGEDGYDGHFDNYVIYRNTEYSAVGSGGHLPIGGGLHLSYQLLRNQSSGATFLFVSTHLQSGKSAAYDQLREQQTRTVLADAQRIAAQDGGVPVVYAGDFNSYLSDYHPNDGPFKAMQPAHVADSYFVAQSLSNQQFNTVNLYQRTPPRGLAPIDRVFVSPGVGVRGWQELLNLTGGRFAGPIPSDHNPVAVDLTLPY